jgi:hypothetical protein
MSDTKFDHELRQIQAFDEDTFVGPAPTEKSASKEIFEVSSKLDFQRPFKNAPPIPTRVVGTPSSLLEAKSSITSITTAAQNNVSYILPPTDEMRVAGFVAAIFVFSLISILCYFFAR